MFSTLARGYNSLRGDTGTPQSANDTIDKLCDRLLNGTQLEDRRAALLGLKGLSRDWKAEVGLRALPILLGVLEEDAQEDMEMAKAVVETFSLLCEIELIDGRPVKDDTGLRNTDVFLSTPAPLHTLLSLLTLQHFYLRFFSLQLLGILLANRAAQVQSHVLTAAGGVGKLVEALDDSREIIRNEALLLMIALATSNADIQKLLVFEGAFDKLFQIIRQEGGINAGGIVAQDCLAAIAGLLRWNVSNQNYFRETSCIPLLVPLLGFPSPQNLNHSTLKTFAFQMWSEQKVINAGLVVSLVRMLVSGAGSSRDGNQKAMLSSGMTRCLTELALASNAPAVLKSQSLHALADILRNSKPNHDLLANLLVTPLIPPVAPSDEASYALAADEDGNKWARPPAGGFKPSDHKWRRGTECKSLTAITSLAIDGDGTPGRDGLKVRGGAANLFQSYVSGSSDASNVMLVEMATPRSDEQPETTGSILTQAIKNLPSSSKGDVFDSYTPFLGCLLFSHLLYQSEQSKELALRIFFMPGDDQPNGQGDEDDRTSLVNIIVGNLMMAQREQAQSVNTGAGSERCLEWSRIMIGYLIVLSVWLWESPSTVKEFLSEGSNLQVLIQPIAQSTGVDSVVQGLCAFLLGICYEFNREPGTITRETLYPILQNRVGPDQFVSRILRLREDPRFRGVGPSILELPEEEERDDYTEEDGLWFDYAFVEFLKNNYISVQRSILLDPASSTHFSRGGATDGEELATLHSTIAMQAKDLEDLRAQIVAFEGDQTRAKSAYTTEVESLSTEVLSLRKQVDSMKTEKLDAEREQEDLLVLLEDLTFKRKRDKARMKEAGMEVSEDENSDDDD